VEKQEERGGHGAEEQGEASRRRGSTWSCRSKARIICLLSTLQQHDSGEAKVYEGVQEE